MLCKLASLHYLIFDNLVGPWELGNTGGDIDLGTSKMGFPRGKVWGVRDRALHQGESIRWEMENGVWQVRRSLLMVILNLM